MNIMEELFGFYRYGARSLQLSKIVPSICKLLDDQNSQVIWRYCL